MARGIASGSPWAWGKFRTELFRRFGSQHWLCAQSALHVSEPDIACAKPEARRQHSLDAHAKMSFMKVDDEVDMASRACLVTVLACAKLEASFSQGPFLAWRPGVRKRVLRVRLLYEWSLEGFQCALCHGYFATLQLTRAL